jgi:hypothetical protein
MTTMTLMMEKERAHSNKMEGVKIKKCVDGYGSKKLFFSIGGITFMGTSPPDRGDCW